MVMLRNIMYHSEEGNFILIYKILVSTKEPFLRQCKFNSISLPKRLIGELHRPKNGGGSPCIPYELKYKKNNRNN